MLRITLHETPDSLCFKLEGRLAGPWVHELEASWREAVARHPEAAVRIDLSEVTYIDPSGKVLLSAIRAQGGELIAACCVMKAVVAEIGQPSAK
jgi:anti-anti-sigma regulatory factor